MSPRRSPESCSQIDSASVGDRGRAGFTLIEVLVALGVCGIVIAAIAPMVGMNALHARQSDSRLALIAAQRSVLDILPAREDLRAGTVSGSINGVRWRLQATAIPRDPRAPPYPWLAFRIAINLETADGLTGRVDTVRLGRAPQP